MKAKPWARAALPAILAIAALFASPGKAPAQALAVAPADLRIEAREDGGYDLYVRSRPGLGSILLTESTKDPAMKADNFAYRAAEYNAVNGDERRMLNGKFLPPTSRLYSLISSTPVPDEAFGRAFRILIPPVLLYGYAWSRSGTVSVGKGTFINIRAFAKPYADYAGAFLDNPYQIAVSARPNPPPPPPPEEPQKAAPPPPADDRTSSKIGAAIATDPGKSLDLVVCLDTTASMEPYIEDIKKNLGPIVRARVAGFKSFRVGLVFYKDYWPEEYITRKYPFTADIEAFERSLKSAVVFGGGDIPEAEIEALYSAETEFDWQADRRQIILVTDAPPHPIPRGKLAFGDVVREAAARRLEIDAITEPKTIPSPNPGHPYFEQETKSLALLAASGVSVRLLEKDEGPSPDDGDTAALDAALGSLAAAKGVSLVSQAADAAANYELSYSTASTGAFSETVSRLVEASTGRELARDVIWRARSEGLVAEFVNGVRTK